MDEAHIHQVVAQHLEQLDEARKAAATRVGPTPADVWNRHIGALIGRLGQEALDYCSIYNSAIGESKLMCKSREQGINVVADSLLRLPRRTPSPRQTGPLPTTPQFLRAGQHGTGHDAS